MSRSQCAAVRTQPETDRRASASDSQPGEARYLRSALESVLIHDINRRLLKARHAASQEGGRSSGSREGAEVPHIGPEHVNALASLSLHPDADAVKHYVQQFRNDGVSIEVLYLELLAPAARRIGEMWEEDTCDFLMVTLGAMRIQQVIHDLSPAFTGLGHEPSSRRIFITCVPGSMHTLGSIVLADFFRREGWEVVTTHDHSRAEIIQAVRREFFDVVAISIGSSSHITFLSGLISEIRKASLNRGILLMAGGAIAASVPDLASRVGADVVTLDAKEAVQVAGRLVTARATAQA